MPIVLQPIWLPPGGVGGGSTAGQLLQELGQRMGDYAAGSVSALSTDTTYLDDNTRTEPDWSFNFGWLTYTGTAAAPNTGLERRITAYDGSVNVGRFLLGNGNAGSGLAVPAQVGDTYAVHVRFSRRRKLGAINRAIRRLPQGFWRRIEDTSIQTTPNTWTYTLPIGLVKPLEVYVQASLNMSGSDMLGTGIAGQGFPYNRVEGWTIRTNVDLAGVVTRVLQFDRVPPWPRYLRIVGEGIQSVLTNDSDVVSVGQDDYDQRLAEYLLSYAAGYLWMEGADGAPFDQASRNVDMVKLSMQLAAELRNDLVMPPPPLEINSPATVSRPIGGDNAFYFAALSTPGPK